MESGKRASMREGPLAALFRKTDEEGASQAEVHSDPARVPERQQSEQGVKPESVAARPPAASRERPRAEPLPARERPRAEPLPARQRPHAERVAPRREASAEQGPPPESAGGEPARPAVSRYDGVPSAEERLRTVFSSDIPENIMERAPEPVDAPPAEGTPS